MKFAGFSKVSTPLRALYKPIFHRSDWKKRMIYTRSTSEQPSVFTYSIFFNVVLFGGGGGASPFLLSAFLGRLYLLFPNYRQLCKHNCYIAPQKQLTESFDILIGWHRTPMTKKKGHQGSGKTVFWHLIRMSTFSINSFPMEGIDKKTFQQQKLNLYTAVVYTLTARNVPNNSSKGAASKIM